MQSVYFALKRLLISLADSVAWPFRWLYNMWYDSKRGRYLVFGLPSILIGFLAISAALFAGTASKRAFVSRYKVARDEAVQNGDWREAITYARKLAELQPDNNDARLELAQILVRDNSESKASSQNLAEAIFSSLAPPDEAGHPAAHVRQAQVILNSQRLTPAQRLRLADDHVTSALSVEPENEDALVLKAKILAERQDFQGAEDIYRQLYREYPGYVVKIVEMMRFQRRASEAEPIVRDAVGRYKELVAKSPTNLNYIRRLANCYAMLEEFDNGVSLLREGIDNVEDIVEKNALRRVLSNLYLAKARVYSVKAIEDVDARKQYLDSIIEAYRVDPNNDGPRRELTIFALRGLPESEQALAVYDGKQDPDEAPDSVLQLLGTDALVKGDVERGISFLEKGLEKNPSNHHILNNLAFALIDTDTNRANELANRAVRLDPNQPNYRDTRGNINKKLGHYDKAINDFETAILDDRMKNNISVYESLVECYEAMGMFSQAASYQSKVDELRRQQPVKDPQDIDGN